jgi:hypothetical protein
LQRRQVRPDADLWQMTARSTRGHHVDVAAILHGRHRTADPFTQALTGPAQ